MWPKLHWGTGLPEKHHYHLISSSQPLSNNWVRKALLFTPSLQRWKGVRCSSAGKESACNAGDPDSIPGSERSAGEGMGYSLQYSLASLVAQLVKNLPTMWETWVRSLGWEDPLEKGTHSSILVWRIRKEWDTTEWLSLHRSGNCWLRKVEKLSTQHSNLMLHESRACTHLTRNQQVHPASWVYRWRNWGTMRKATPRQPVVCYVCALPTAFRPQAAGWLWSCWYWSSKSRSGPATLLHLGFALN